MSVYAMSDIHGNSLLWNKIKDFLKDDDVVYILGDMGDRGPDGWQLIKEAYYDKRFIYLMGNHEKMLKYAMQEWIESERHSRVDYNLLKYNGGANTFNGWRKDGSPESWIVRLNNLPLHATYVNKDNICILMSHAGFTPKDEVPKNDDLLWDREHFLDPWNEDYENTIVLHGHTPIIYVADELNDPETEIKMRPYWYCNGKKVCIDLMTYHTNAIMLFNLDTFEHHLFEVEE